MANPEKPTASVNDIIAIVVVRLKATKRRKNASMPKPPQLKSFRTWNDSNKWTRLREYRFIFISQQSALMSVFKHLYELEWLWVSDVCGGDQPAALRTVRRRPSEDAEALPGDRTINSDLSCVCRFVSKPDPPEIVVGNYALKHRWQIMNGK